MTCGQKFFLHQKGHCSNIPMDGPEDDYLIKINPVNITEGWMSTFHYREAATQPINAQSANLQSFFVFCVRFESVCQL